MRLVFVDNLEPGMVVGADICAPEDGEAILVTKGTRLTRVMIQGLEQRHIRFAYIDDRPRRRRGPIALSDDPTRERENHRPGHNLYVPEPRPTLRPGLRDSALNDLEELFASADRLGTQELHDSAQVIRHLETVVDELVDTVQSDPAALINISDLKSYDEYTFHHSLSVAVLSLAIGQHLGFDRDTMRELGLCAILHDIGKTKIPIEIINKTSRLDDREFAIIQGHSAAGFDYLCRHSFSGAILEGVLHHHEKLDGSGYPNGLAGERIPPWSRIITVADVYDALTSKRPYRDPMQPGEAVEYLMGGVGSAFDYDMVKAFVEKMELYPVGRAVQLSTGAVARVLDNQQPMRPLIRLESDGRIIDLYRDRNARSMVIIRLLPDIP